MTNSYTRFWQGFLSYASETGSAGRKLWNGYLYWKVADQPGVHIRPVESNPPSKVFAPYVEELTRDQKEQLDELANELGGHPTYFAHPDSGRYPYMDFSGCEFDGASFEGLMFINVNFSSAVFKAAASFRKAIFVDPVVFRGCTFKRRAIFHGATLTNSVDFTSADFQEFALFDSANFRGYCSFEDAKFLPKITSEGNRLGGAGFRNAKFSADSKFNCVKFAVRADYGGCEFEDAVEFRNSTFEDAAKFEQACFRAKSEFNGSGFLNEANFNDARFGSTTSFAGAHFVRPPKFFETDLHEDTDFSGVDWRAAEASYAPVRSPCCRNTKSPEQSTLESVDVYDAIRAWDRLSLIASKLERFPEKHEFYRLRMRAQRWADGRGLPSVANWIFDTISEYGWSVGKSLASWVLHWLLIGIVLFTCAAHQAIESNPLTLLFNSILTSFANAHAFLGLGSEGGPLHSAKVLISGSEPISGLARAMGVIQAFTGPVFLFLVLLSIRNRFRLR